MLCDVEKVNNLMLTRLTPVATLVTVTQFALKNYLILGVRWRPQLWVSDIPREYRVFHNC